MSRSDSATDTQSSQQTPAVCTKNLIDAFCQTKQITERFQTYIIHAVDIHQRKPNRFQTDLNLLNSIEKLKRPYTYKLVRLDREIEGILGNVVWERVKRQQPGNQEFLRLVSEEEENWKRWFDNLNTAEE
jgi:hypothetical protein